VQVPAYPLSDSIDMIKTADEDGYPIEAMQIQRFEGENWKLQGDVIQAPH